MLSKRTKSQIFHIRKISTVTSYVVFKSYIVVYKIATSAAQVANCILLHSYSRTAASPS